MWKDTKSSPFHDYEIFVLRSTAFLGFKKNVPEEKNASMEWEGFFCFVLFVFSFYIIGALVYFNNFNDEKNYISKASFLKKRDHGAPELLQKQNTLIYTRYRSNYKKKYKETSLWKVSSPNKTDCVNLLIFSLNVHKKRGPKKFRINLNNETKSSFF